MDETARDVITDDTIFLVEPKGSKFSVGLVAKSGTGYQWTQELPKTDVVKFLGEAKPTPLGPAPGSPVEFRFDYDATRHGQVAVKFNLIGPDKKVHKTDRFDFVVK